MKTASDRAITDVERRQRRGFRLPSIGLFQSMRVTIRAMLSKAVTVQYPEERLELPPRTRGVIALLEENCTVCMLCSKECPCWCIYIEGHKERTPGKRKAVNALDRFAIDYGLCMYCGICVEVCPFDALHWSPAFEYTSYTYEGMVHERDVLSAWEYKVLPPPLLVDDADEAAHKKVGQDAAKRSEGVYGLIREAPKKEAYAALYGTEHQAPTPAEAGMLPVIPPRLVIQPTPQISSGPAEQPVAAPEAAPPPPPPTPPPAAPSAPSASAPSAPAASSAPAADAAALAGLPRIDPNNLPAGIGPVERGRLKKLAHFQEHGRVPPADLIENLKHILDQMPGSG